MEKDSPFIKVRREGHGKSVVLTMGKVIPDGWKIVRIVLEDALPGKWVRVRIEKVA